MAQMTADINFEIAIAHGVNGWIGFEWHGTFIHNPFAGMCCIYGF